MIANIMGSNMSNLSSTGIRKSWAEAEPFVPSSSSNFEAEVSLEVQVGFASNFAEQDIESGVVHHKKGVRSWVDAEEFIPRYLKSGVDDYYTENSADSSRSENSDAVLIQNLLPYFGKRDIYIDYEVLHLCGQRVLTAPQLNKCIIPESGSEVVVKNLPPEATLEELVPLLERAGPLLKLRFLLHEDTMSCRGFAYATYYSRREAMTAVKELDKRKFLGSILQIEASTPEILSKGTSQVDRFQCQISSPVMWSYRDPKKIISLT